MVNGGMLFVTAAFSSTVFGFDRLHDRNLFYLAPLWLVVLGVWLADGLPRPRVALAVGIAAAVALPLVLPFRYIAGDVGVDVVPSALWARLNEQLAGEVVTARKLLVLLLVVLVVAIAVLPRRYGWVFPAVMLASFAVTGTLAWDRIIDARENAVFEGEGSGNRSWIDDRVPSDAHVTKLYLDSTRCPSSALTRHALYLTEFFNATVDRAAYIDDSIPDGLPDLAGRRWSRRTPRARVRRAAPRGLRLHAAGHRDRWTTSWGSGRRHTSSCGRSEGRSASSARRGTRT